ncbi:hypothetical protein LIER_25032 [Lithospermum erythrorhizon]|uniref:Uncharacterized protein n=1 Tax=Lithospermum erythrorhizon TaxID=34254 RepID=A0AAV3R4T7_LITER
MGKEGYEDTIRRAWAVEVQGSRWFVVNEKIKLVRIALIDWCKNNNLNSRVRIDVIQVKIREAFESSNGNRSELLSLEKDLDDAWGTREILASTWK